MKRRLPLCSWPFAAVAIAFAFAAPLHAQISSQIPDSGGKTIQPSPIVPPGDGEVLPGPTPISDGTPPVTALSVQQAWKNTAGNTDFNAGTSWNSGVAPGAGDVAAFSGVEVS